MTHVKDYSIGVWDITNFLIIFAASNDTCKTNSFFLASLQHQMTHVKDYSIGVGDIANFHNIFEASNDTCMDKQIHFS